MDKVLKVALIFICVFFIPNITTAGTYEGLISEVWVNDVTNDNVGWIKLPTNMTDGTCPNKNWVTIDFNKESMKLALSIALTAFTAGKEVRLGASGPCSSNGSGYESLKYIGIK